MMSWTEVPIHVLSVGTRIDAGRAVPARIVVMELFARDGRVPGFAVGAELAEVDLTGLEGAVTWLALRDLDLPSYLLASSVGEA